MRNKLLLILLAFSFLSKAQVNEVHVECGDKNHFCLSGGEGVQALFNGEPYINPETGQVAIFPTLNACDLAANGDLDKFSILCADGTVQEIMITTNGLCCIVECDDFEGDPEGLCAEVIANPAGDLALADCDNGGINNLTECETGGKPFDPGDDKSCDKESCASLINCLPGTAADCVEGSCTCVLLPCEDLLTGEADICSLIEQYPELAELDCDNGGVSNGDECDAGQDPKDPSDDVECTNESQCECPEGYSIDCINNVCVCTPPDLCADVECEGLTECVDGECVCTQTCEEIANPDNYECVTDEEGNPILDEEGNTQISFQSASMSVAVTASVSISVAGVKGASLGGKGGKGGKRLAECGESEINVTCGTGCDVCVPDPCVITTPCCPENECENVELGETNAETIQSDLLTYAEANNCRPVNYQICSGSAFISTTNSTDINGSCNTSLIVGLGCSDAITVVYNDGTVYEHTGSLITYETSCANVVLTPGIDFENVANYYCGPLESNCSTYSVVPSEEDGCCIVIKN